jgi:hypothetical protein
MGTALSGSLNSVYVGNDGAVVRIGYLTRSVAVTSARRVCVMAMGMMMPSYQGDPLWMTDRYRRTHYMDGPILWCRPCGMSMLITDWPYHYRTKAHRANLHAKP